MTGWGGRQPGCAAPEDAVGGVSSPLQTNADGGYSWSFSADTNHKNRCSKDTEPPPSALAKWTKLTSITQPTQSRTANFNATFTDSFGDWHWERKN